MRRFIGKDRVSGQHWAVELVPGPANQIAVDVGGERALPWSSEHDANNYIQNRFTVVRELVRIRD